MQGDEQKTFTVVALTVGEPGAPELWMLRALAALPVRLYVVRARTGRSVSRVRRFRSLVRQHGVLAVASRVAGGLVFQRWDRRVREATLNRLFDEPALRAWWEASGLVPVEVSHLNNPDAREVLERLSPDVMIRVSGGILKPATFSIARIATLNVHHGRAPMIRGMWSIPWGIVEGRPDWIGATVHVIDDGIDTGTVLWRGAPQIAPGDTSDDLFFRVHLQAVDAMADILKRYAAGERVPRIEDTEVVSEYRSTPGLLAWWRFWRSGRGAKSEVTISSAWQSYDRSVS